MNTPSGRPASANSSASTSDAPGSFSEGFSTNVFPHAIAFANIQMGTIAGKLNGVMPATTPRGWRIEKTSTPVETCSENPPFSRWGMPVANSTFSRPRCTSPIASESTLPCCDVRTLATSALRVSISSRIRNMISARLESDVARHAGSASLGGLDGRAHLGNVGEVDLVRLHTGRRVEHGSRSSGLAGYVLAADVVADPLHAAQLLRTRARGFVPGDGTGAAGTTVKGDARARYTAGSRLSRSRRNP